MIVFIQGPPASGKSTLGMGLSAKLNIPHVSKDDIKENLFDSLGARDAAWSRELGAASNRLLFLLVRKYASLSRDIIIESNFSRDEVAEIERTLAGGSQDVCDVFLTAPPDVLMARFRERWESGRRHPGHVDDQRYEDIESYIAEQKSRPMGLGIVQIRINTEREGPDSVLSTVLAQLAAVAASQGASTGPSK